MNFEGADFVLTPGLEDISPNKTAEDLEELRARLRPICQQADRNYVALLIAQLFIQNDQVESFDLGIWREWQGDDEGNYNIDTSCRLDDVTFKDDPVAAEDSQDDSGTDDEDADDEAEEDDDVAYLDDEDDLDASAMQEKLYDRLSDQVELMVNAFFGPGEMGSASFSFSYDMIAELVASGAPITGEQAYEALFADQLSAVEEA